MVIKNYATCLMAINTVEKSTRVSVKDAASEVRCYSNRGQGTTTSDIGEQKPESNKALSYRLP